MPGERLQPRRESWRLGVKITAADALVWSTSAPCQAGIADNPAQPQTNPLKGNTLPPSCRFSSPVRQEGPRDEALARSPARGVRAAGGFPRRCAETRGGREPGVARAIGKRAAAHGAFPEGAAAPSRAGRREETRLRCHPAPSAELGATAHTEHPSGAGTRLGRAPREDTRERPAALAGGWAAPAEGPLRAGLVPCPSALRGPSAVAVPADGQVSVKARPGAAQGQAAGTRQQKLS